MEHAGYHWDVASLEKELELNQHAVDTRSEDFVIFFVNHEIPLRCFDCKTIEELAHILANGSPVISILRRAILHERFPYNLIVAPIRSITTWFESSQQARRPCHSVVIFGIDKDRVCIFDPYNSTVHRVRWDQFKELTVPDFANIRYLTITKL
ncbi:MAG: hypothetical protein CMJ78_12665 [Planctomycetaceae bacterium]|nr:hypothetical protein [Planctomycetaceae bacterium]